MKKIKSGSFVLLVIFLFFGWYFAFQTNLFDFWIRMTLTTLVAAVLAIIMGGKVNIVPNRLEIPIIIIVSIFSYVLFLILDLISSFIPLFNAHINSVYKLSEGQNVLKVVITLLLIAFFEEIIWRGFITEYLLQTLNIVPAIFISSILYSVVHIFTGNVALIGGAFFLGLILAFVYTITGKVSTTAFIHAIWGLLVFLIFPFD
ncbi:CPBP family intramembrane metalloprotease [Thermosipho ferrireducens]|uniref:CPBP family intramembrane metalloprotease n=1 Tax=Thermosipho ferrireducens TaxID=2571116 RepID=A0ABX7S4Z5_9BACT|nr:CPBP family intramembrane glutamic endopeptidase [Thermosipho ferrireducens]QTA37569.1 CPBP family intramembrane metalloprotease [Thermosipho ferrireducens]